MNDLDNPSSIIIFFFLEFVCYLYTNINFRNGSQNRLHESGVEVNFLSKLCYESIQVFYVLIVQIENKDRKKSQTV